MQYLAQVLVEQSVELFQSRMGGALVDCCGIEWLDNSDANCSIDSQDNNQMGKVHHLPDKTSKFVVDVGMVVQELLEVWKVEQEDATSFAQTYIQTSGPCNRTV